MAVTQAKEEAKPDYAAANRIQLEQIGGPQSRSSIRSWGYEGASGWGIGDGGWMRRPEAGGAHRASGGSGPGSLPRTRRSITGVRCDWIEES